MNMTQIEYFLAVSRLNTLTAAAENEHASVSSISKQIHKLEDELGVILFERRRGKREIALTPAGIVFKEFAEETFGDWRHITRLMKQYGSKRSSTVRLGSLPILACYGLANLIADFQLDNLAIQLEVYEREQVNLLRRLDFGQITFAVLRTDRLSPERYNWKPIIQDELVVAMPADHRLANAERLAFSQLRDERFVTFDTDSLLYDTFLTLAQHAGFEPNIVASYSRHDLVLCAVARGVGLALAPAGLCVSQRYGHIHLVPLANPVYTENGVTWLKNHRMSTYERLLVDFLDPVHLDYPQNRLLQV
ncbi:MAG: LysR family transcriptional regulator [Actinomycetes bacterium]|jgi:DNA-binding transcriptional LysR family regulator|nr:LysR family transcriptional regulator [Actinomycetes bacterium]